MVELVRTLPPPSADEQFLKHVNAVALMPVAGGRRISLLGRRLFNVLLHRAQEVGEQEEYEARLYEIVNDAAYNSKDTAPIRKILPPFQGIDFTPMVVIIGMIFLQRLLGL